jgi:microcystin degradation protein MlrC
LARIAIGGFQHETNTFSPTPASYDDFVMESGWPGLSRGKALFDAVAGVNIPIAGFIDAAKRAGHDLKPLLWCSATPSGRVTRDAFERICAELLERLAAIGPIDALFLDLHGAMVPEHLQDGEGELLARVRHLVGRDLPVVTSLDFHANVSLAMIEHASAMIGYRTYPHIDMAETGGHCARLLDRIIAKGPLAKAYRQLPFLIPLTWQCTLADPAARLFRERAELERGEVASLSFTPGFPPADIRICAPSVFAYGESQAAAERAVERLSALVVEAEGDFAGKIWQPDEAVLYAKQRAGRSGKPIVLADTQDNPGAGGNSDTVGLIEALLRNDARDAAIGILYDPRAAAAAHSAGQGADLEIAIGEGTGISDRKPLAGRFRVERLSDGKFAATGPVYAGNHMNLGPMALLKINGLRIVVSSRKQQAADQAIFRHLGVEPAAQKILALKSSVHFRGDFQPIAEEILVVAAPGPNLADHRQLPYRNLKPGIRLMPKGPGFKAF